MLLTQARRRRISHHCHSTIYGQLQRGWRLSLHKGQWVQVALERFQLKVREKFFFSCENNQSQEQPPQRHGKVPIIGGFQDVIVSLVAQIGCLKLQT